MSNARTLASLIDGSNIVVPSGYGLDFSANANASGMTSEVLDDYEEGTWVPSLSGATYSSGTRYGYYKKIGNLVIANCVFDNASVTSGSSVGIDGLPFTVSSGTGSTRFPGFTSHTTGTALSVNITGGYARQGETNFQLLQSNSSSTVSLSNGTFSMFLTSIYISA